MNNIKNIDCKLTIRDEKSVEYVDDYDRSFRGELPNNELGLRTIKRFNRWVADCEDNCEKEDLQILGEYLYHLLFDAVDTRFQRRLETEFEQTYNDFEKARGDEKSDLRLRLYLIFEEKAKDLAILPWEFIYIPIATPENPGGFFAAGQQINLILTRFVSSEKLRRKRSRSKQKSKEKILRILIAFSHPWELPKIDANDVISNIKNLEHVKPDEINVKVFENPTYQKLKDEMEAFRPHIFHFIGHGRPRKIALIRDKQKIEEDEKLTGKKEEAHWINSNTVGGLFTEHQPQLVFLHACEGATESLEGFKSTAREVISSNIFISAVVAMQYKIRNPDAVNFANTFYQEISDGKPIDEAVKEGRRKLGLYHITSHGTWGDRRFGTPVVYLQSEEAIIYSREPASKPIPEPRTAPARQSCPYGCSWLINPDSKCCGMCGKPLMKCPSCERFMTQESQYCDRCGYDMISRPVNIDKAETTPQVNKLVPEFPDNH